MISKSFNELSAYYLFSVSHFLIGTADAQTLGTVSTVMFAVGSSGTINQCRRFAVTDDSILEGNEDFTVQITGATPGVTSATTTVDGASSTTVVTITDNDSKYC